jgi:hypothetical protein
VLAARAAFLGQGQLLDIDTVDLSYKTYKKDNVTVNANCINAFPSNKADRAKKTRQNYNKNTKRFISWYKTGDRK